jgi:phosphate transport system permease protein
MATSVPVSAPSSWGARVFVQRLRSGDEIARLITLAFATSILLVTVGLVYELWITSALPRQKFGLSFLTSSSWDPVSGQFGALPFIYGTVITSAIALIIAVPIGVGAAIFLAELAPARVSSTFTFFIELLAAVPSVIYGLLAIFTLVPLMRDYVDPFLKKTLGFLPIFSGTIYGYGYLTAGVILAVMTLPFIISISREALLEVPTEQREAALALGATRWESTWQAVVPWARLGIFGSIFLALARALGETMAVTMVIGNDPSIHASLFSPGYAIAPIIANEFTEATGDLYLQSLVGLGLVLFLLTIVINALARLLIIATTRRGSAHQ